MELSPLLSFLFFQVYILISHLKKIKFSEIYGRSREVISMRKQNYDSHELVVLTLLCASFSLSDYLKVGQMTVCLCFSLLFSTKIAELSLFALGRLTHLEPRCACGGRSVVTQSWPPFVHQVFRWHLATGALKSMRVNFECGSV